MMSSESPLLRPSLTEEVASPVGKSTPAPAAACPAAGAGVVETVE